MTSGDVFRFLKEERSVVLSIILFAVIGAVAAGQLMPAGVSATAQVIVHESDVSMSLLGVQESANPVDHDVLMDTHIRLAASPTIAKRVIDRLGLGEKPQEVLDRVTVSVQGRSNVLVFSAVGPTADEAVALTDAWVTEYLAWRSELSNKDLRVASDNLAPRVSAAEARLAELEARVKAGGHTREIDTAISAAATDYEQLLAGSSRLELLSSLDAPPLTVVSPAIAEDRSVGLSIMLDALKGVVVGVFLALFIVFLIRRPSRSVQPD